MLYQEYRQKNKKRIEFLEKLWKRRFYILGAFVLLLAVIAALLGITGIVFGESFPVTVTYGEALNFEAKAIFRDAAVEYRAVGGNWSSEEPKLVGEYEARGVSTDAVGNERYGEAMRFTIQPRPAEVTVVGEEFLYGESPSASALLAEGDRLTAFVFDYDWGRSLSCDVSVREVTVKNEADVDVTHCYTFTYPEKRLEVIPRAVTLSTAGAEREYDGTPLSAKGYEFVSGSLAYADRIEMTYSVSQTEAGTAENIPELTILSEDGQDVTAFYTIQWEPGSLTVTPREVSFVSRGASRTYGDVELSAPAPLSGSFVRGHSLVLLQDVSAFDAGSYPYEEIFSVIDGEGRNVTANYDLDFGGAALTVVPRPITVWTGSATWIYDGELHDTAYEGGYGLADSSPYPLLAGHYLSPDPESEQLTDITDTETEVVTVENPLRLFVLNEREEDMTDNYAIVYERGELRIKSPVIVTFFCSLYLYDGNEHAIGEGQYTIVKPPDAAVEVFAERLPSLTDAGEIYLEDIIAANEEGRRIVSITDPYTGRDAYSENRLDLAAMGTPVLQVLPRPITIATASASVLPSGEMLIGAELENPWWVSIGSSIVSGQTLEVEVTGVLSPTQEEAENTVGMLLVLDRYGNDVTHNYAISFDFGTLSWIME